MRLLLIGKGGREHALAWKLSQSPQVEHVYVVPGNGGTARGLHNVSNVDHVAMDDYVSLVKLADQLQIGLVVVGPDSAIVDGIEGYFRQAEIPCFAPAKEAAEIEGSKVFAKNFMKQHDIPTADYRDFDNYDDAKAYLTLITHDVVIKADGLAAGKGVVIPASKEEAICALENIMVNKRFGSAGSSVIIEEFLSGQEISVSTLSDGKTTMSLPVGQDHKRMLDGENGPNTGGMGVYAPVPVVTSAMMETIENEILRPTFEGLRQQGRNFVGLLFTGVMLTQCGPKVLEYNARFGDPETQSIIPLLGSEVDLAEVMMACVEGRLNKVKIKILPMFACNVVIAAGGYPGRHRRGDVVEIRLPPKDIIIFHAGTQLAGKDVVTADGRVFTVVGMGETLQEAVKNAYNGVQSIQFTHMFYRKDIAHRALGSN